MTRHTLLAALVLSSLMSACAWVKMSPGGEAVRVARADEDMSACTRRGEVAVSVKASVGPIQRDHIKVLDELEMLARNEAGGLHADTVQAKGPPVDGEQRFLAYACGAQRGSVRAQPVAQPAAGGAETFPVQER